MCVYDLIYTVCINELCICSMLYYIFPCVYHLKCIRAYACILYYTHGIYICMYIGYIPPEGAVDRGLVQHRQNSLIRGTGLTQGVRIMIPVMCTLLMCMYFFI